MSERGLNACQFYGYAVIQLLIEPRRFFSELPDHAGITLSLGFCLICSLFFISAGMLTIPYPDPARMIMILFCNSLGLMLVSSAVSYLVIRWVLPETSPYTLILSIHAYASGIVLLVSWITFFFWLTEIWKWWLICTGFRNTCGLSAKSSLLAAGLTLVIQFAFLYSLYPDWRNGS